jgi:CrcB protein
MSVLAWTGLALLGGVGAILRGHLDAIVQQRATGDFPLGTLAVNVTGSFALGVLTGADVGGDTLAVTGVGLLGSFTTFSTWILETERLGEEGDDRLGLLNIGIAIVAGLGAASLGWALGAWA